eukprot:symbB.v1.2.008619.t1/scaffold516.1/size216213/5
MSHTQFPLCQILDSLVLSTEGHHTQFAPRFDRSAARIEAAAAPIRTAYAADAAATPATASAAGVPNSGTATPADPTLAKGADNRTRGCVSSLGAVLRFFNACIDSKRELGLEKGVMTAAT